MIDENLNPKRGRRVTIDLSPAATEEIERIAAEVGTSVPAVFRQSFGLFRLYVQAMKAGQRMIIEDPKDVSERRQIELVMPNNIREET